jgi:hypothetical protein
MVQDVAFSQFLARSAMKGYRINLLSNVSFRNQGTLLMVQRSASPHRGDYEIYDAVNQRILDSFYTSREEDWRRLEAFLLAQLRAPKFRLVAFSNPEENVPYSYVSPMQLEYTDCDAQRDVEVAAKAQWFQATIPWRVNPDFPTFRRSTKKLYD